MITNDGIELADGMIVWACTCRLVGHKYVVIAPYRALYVKKDDRLIPMKDDGTLTKRGTVYRDRRSTYLNRNTAIREFNYAVDDLVDRMRAKIDEYIGLKVRY